MKRTSKGIAIASVASAAALVGLAAGGALAAPANHSAIKLRDPAGAVITKNQDGTAKAFSVKKTCFTTDCHNDGTTANGGGKAAFSYDDIERHSYHAQIGANEIRGFNPYNVDSDDKWRFSAGPQGKNWVQSPGHVGSW